MAMLGPCNDLPDNVVVNEFSTVAAVFTFRQFMHPYDPEQVSASGAPGTTQYIGATNAGATLAKNLVNIASGTPATFLNAVSPANSLPSPWISECYTSSYSARSSEALLSRRLIRAAVFLKLEFAFLLTVQAAFAEDVAQAGNRDSDISSPHFERISCAVCVSS
jgi:hypothetical protein